METVLQRVVRFTRWQFLEMRRGGLAVLVRKVAKALGIALLILPALLVVFMVRLLRPVKTIRFGRLRSERIGHFAANTEIYLCERDAGLHEQNVIEIFYYSTPVSNEQLKKMWGRLLHIAPWFVSPLIWQADALNRRLPGGKAHEIPVAFHNARDVHGLLKQTSPRLSFSDNEEDMGSQALRKLGISAGSEFVCFHARDPAYLRHAHPKQDWGEHDYRDCNIRNYLPAIEELVDRGYYAIRMGAVVVEALKAANPRIIDYATSGKRTDFLDIYLLAKCRFFIVSDAGIYAVPAIFRRPIVFVNFPALELLHTWHPDYLSIPKKFRLRKEGRNLTFRELLDSGIGRFGTTEQFEKHGIEVVENTPEEIAGAVIEMDQRLNGTWRTTDEDEELQRRFWSLFRHSKWHGQKIVSRIGTEFLRQNYKLLD